MRGIEEAREHIRDNMPEAALFEQLAEECSELAHASLKYARILRGENPTPVSDIQALNDLMKEWYDVCVAAFICELGREEEVRRNAYALHKLTRWVKRLDGDLKGLTATQIFIDEINDVLGVEDG